MGRNQMLEIALGNALDILSDVEIILDEQCALLEGEIASVKAIVPERDGAELIGLRLQALENKLTKYNKLNSEIKRIRKRGESLDF
jgi:hypothetical protein